MATNTPHLNAETLDLWLLSALTPEEVFHAEQHIASCPLCASALQERQEDAAHFTQFVQPRTLNAVIERTSSSSFARWFSSWKMWVPLTSLVAATLLVTWMAQPGTIVEPPYIGIKGSGQPWFEVVVARGEHRQFQLKEGDRLNPDDRLEFVVEPADTRHVLVASRDGAGQFSVYFPFQKTESERVDPKRQILPGSVALDRVLGEETLWVIFSKEPIQAKDVKEAMLRGDSASLKSASVQALRFVKVLP